MLILCRTLFCKTGFIARKPDFLACEQEKVHTHLHIPSSDQHLCLLSGKYNTGAYPGFLDSEFKFTKGV